MAAGLLVLAVAAAVLRRRFRALSVRFGSLLLVFFTTAATVSGGHAGVRLPDTAPARDAISTKPVTLVHPCGPAGNMITCENSLPGSPTSEWDISGAGDPTLQGYATQMSVNAGETVHFKIKSTAARYRIVIYRLGYYQGNGARRITSFAPRVEYRQPQPACLVDKPTGLVDCGNWAESGSWEVPLTAVSGLYVARLARLDTGGASQIPFIVRDDSSRSDILLQTSDETWEAYNTYGGNSLYSCTVACPAGNPLTYKGAFKVSYNRPFNTRETNVLTWWTAAEYPLIRFLERNGYDLTYTTDVDTAIRGSLLRRHQIFISSGHDEYSSGEQRTNVETARDSGVNLAFFTGNALFWKTRWEPSLDAGHAADRTIVTYKETHFVGPIDPKDPPTWTGTWRDLRHSPPGDGGRPENQLTGTIYVADPRPTLR